MVRNDEEKKDDDVKKMNSQHHTMFIQEQCEVKTHKSGNLYEITPASKSYRVFIDSFMEYERGLHEIFNTLWNADESDTIEFRINSSGGLVKEGQQFYNIIKNKFNGRTTTILDSMAYSMGALLFCAGDKRIATEQSDLMFHDYSSFEFGKGSEIEESVKHTSKHIRKFFKEVIVDKGFLNKKEFEQMLIGRDFWMDVDELCRRKIATHVLVNGKEVTAKKYLKSK